MAERCKYALGILTLTLVWCRVSADDSARISDYFKDQAALRYTDNESPQYTRDYGPHGDLFTLTRADFKRLKVALRSIPFQNPSFEIIDEIANTLEADPSYPWEEIAAEYLGGNLEESLVHDEELRSMLLSYKPISISSEGVRLTDEDVIDDIPEPEDRDQTQGWEGCLADYDAYIGPFTDYYRYITELRLRELIPGPPLPVDDPLEQPQWSTLLLDANGKRPTGLSQGRKHWVGAVEVCVDIAINYNATMNATSITEDRIFKGKYARLDMPLDLSGLGLNGSFVFPFQLGVCVPDTCNADDLRRYILEVNPVLSTLFTGPGFISRNVSDVYFGSTAEFSDDIAAKVAVGIAIAGTVIIVFATCYDGWGRPQVIRKKIKKYVTGSTEGKHDPLTVEELKYAKKYLYEKPSLGDKIELMFAGYSLYTSIARLFTTRKEHRDFHIPALDGLRVLMILWVIKGMTYVYGIVYFESWTTDNLITALLEYTSDWRFMLILATPLANHGLFFISGFVCVQMWYKTYKLNGNRIGFGTCIGYILLRWISLMPVTMGMLMFYTCLYQFTEGPLNPSRISDATNCRNTWWTVLVLMHNLVKTDEQCMSWTWMIAAVFQLNLVSLFVILIPLVLARVAAYVMMVAMYITFLVMTIIWHQKRNEGEVSWYYDIIQTPWCNAGTYVIGMMMAMIMHDHTPKWNTKGKKAGIFFLWLFAVTGIMTVIYVPWGKYKGDEIISDWSESGQLAYDVMAPQILGLSLAWIIYACHYGYGGIFGSFLNWRAFTTLAKICLPTVVFMGPMMTGHMYARMTTFYIHENHMANLYFGHLISLFKAGVFAALFFHYPITKSAKKQFTAKSRLEIFLHCRHPDILDQFCGILDEDKDAWRELEEEAEDEKPKILVDGGGSVDIMRGKKPVGGYVPHQEVDGVPNVGDIVTSKSPIINGVKVPIVVEPRHEGLVNKGYERDSDPPAYETTEREDSSMHTTAF